MSPRSGAAGGNARSTAAVRNLLHAGAARIDITPAYPVWMDGMIRAHRSEGVHDPLLARALVLSNGPGLSDAVVLVSIEICALSSEDAAAARREITRRSGIPVDRIIIAASHTHSGPAAIGFFNPGETGYVETLRGLIADAVLAASRNLVPARALCARGEEPGICHYRRLLADDGHVVMNWESFPPERIVRALGEPDNDIGVLRFDAEETGGSTLALLFHHTGHPNALSGENYLLTAEYPGRAARLLEQRWGGEALYLNGALGSVDIDNFADRGWEGLERLGQKLAAAATRIQESGGWFAAPRIVSASTSYNLPARRISDTDLAWAQGVIERTGGSAQPLPDGVGDDYKAKLYLQLRELQDAPVEVEQVCVALGDPGFNEPVSPDPASGHAASGRSGSGACAFISFPGELYTEIGVEIKKRSPFPLTHLVGLANGYIGYVPTARAIREGGYAEDTRRVDDVAADIVLEESLTLLKDAHEKLRCQTFPFP